MARPRVAAGLDIGSSRVSCVIAKLEDAGDLQVIGLGKAPCRGFRQGNLVNLEEASQAITRAVESAEEMAGQTVESLIVNLKGPHVQSFNHRGAINIARGDKEITEEDVRQVMEAARVMQISQDREILHTLPQDFIVDNQGGVENPIGIDGSHLAVDVHVVTAGRTALTNITKCVNRAGFRCEGLVSSILAVGDVVVTEEEKEIGVVLVDVGAQTTDIALYHKGAAHFIKELPLGGDHITQDVAQGLRTSRAVAQDIKHRFGSAWTKLVDPGEMVHYLSVDGKTQRSVSRKTLCDFILPRVEEILAAVLSECEACPVFDMAAAGVVLTGGGSQLLGMREAVEEVLKLAARIGMPQSVGGLSDVLSSTDFICSLGLVKFSSQDSWDPARRFSRRKNGFVARLKKFWEGFF